MSAPFSVPLKTLTVAGDTANVKEKYNRKIPPPPGFTMASVIVISEVRMSLAAVIGGVSVVKASGLIDEVM